MSRQKKCNEKKKKWHVWELHVKTAEKLEIAESEILPIHLEKLQSEVFSPGLSIV